MKILLKAMRLLHKECKYNYLQAFYRIQYWRRVFDKSGIKMSRISNKFEIVQGFDLVSRDIVYLAFIFALHGYRSDYIEFENFDRRRRFNRYYIKFKESIKLWK